MQMVMYMRGNGSTIKLMVEELIFISMVPSTQESGWRTSSMAMVLKPGLMELATRVTTNTVRSMALAHSSGPTTPFSSVSSSTIIYTAKASTCGATAESTKATGRTTKCTEMACTPGLTDESTWVSMLTIENMAMANLSGPMAARTRETGSRASSMARACM